MSKYMNINFVLGVFMLFSACTTSSPSETDLTVVKSLPIESDHQLSQGQNGDCVVNSSCIDSETNPDPIINEPSSPSEDVSKSYPQRVYGAPLDLVCTHEVQPVGALKNRPNLQLMWEHYLYEKPDGVWPIIGGHVETNGCLAEDKGGWRNACTVRLSHMLNNAGHIIPYVKGQTVSGANGKQYFFRLDDIQAYLTDEFGSPDLDFDDASGHWIELPNAPGLTIMKFPGNSFTGHATIWNGAGTVDGSEIVGFRVLYWKLPCFIPPNRK